MALVCCGLPAGGLGVRVAVLDAGPYRQVENLCAALDSPQSKALVGTARATPAATRARHFPWIQLIYEDRCGWAAAQTPGKITVRAAVRLYDRHFKNGDGRTHAKGIFDVVRGGMARSAREYEAANQYRDLAGVGEAAFIHAQGSAIDPEYIRVEALKGNALILVTVEFDDASTAGPAQSRITDFAATAPAVVNDIIEVLRPR